MSDERPETGVLDYIPEQVPVRSVTSEGVNFPAEDSAGAPWAQATVRVGEDDVSLSECDLDGLPLDSVSERLYSEIDWEEIDLAAVVSMPNGWQTLLLTTVVEDGGQRFLEAVSVPMVTFERGSNPPQWRAAFGSELRRRVDAGMVDTIGDNLDAVLGWADEAY